MTTSTKPPRDAAFDTVAAYYDAQLDAGLSVTGESKAYYARGRAAWLARRLAGLGFTPRTVLDYGCGTGSATPYLLQHTRAERVIGVDVSSESIRLAMTAFGGRTASFHVVTDFVPSGDMDLAFCNGVFHHIAPSARAGVAGYVWRALRPGGVFAFWENNPWNPGTRYVMRRIPFDRDAIPLAPPESRALLRGAGFEILGLDSLFYFPATLSALRWLEPVLAKVPLGGQYLVLCRRPA